MRKYINLFLLILSIGLYSCEGLIDPKPDNILTEEQLLDNPVFTEGLLMKAYTATPNEYTFATDVASDDAVSNDPASVFRSMAVGNWKSTNDPISQWSYAFENIYYLNKFLSIYKDVIWSSDPNLTTDKNNLRNQLHKKRLKGEACGLRAYYKWLLLQYHGGMSTDNRLLGFPIFDQYISADDNWKLPRSTFADCVKNIFTDLDTAIANLPKTWADLPTGGTNPAINGDLNATSGARYLNRMNGNAARALKARVALLAASPAFSASSGVTWAQAASIAGPLLKDLLPDFSATGRVFYKSRTDKEHIWNKAELTIRTWEQNNFPPSLFGYGRTNPTQDLVDAFGMKNGYPISNSASTYNADAPYTNRDPRLTDYIIFNTALLKSVGIKTYISAPSDGINVLLTSTRTGYYLKKFMNESVKLDPGSAVSAAHNYSLFRVTEVLLNYAEAANEAWGPTGDPNAYGFDAKTLLGKIRTRAGITADPYLTSISDAAGLRTLIRNERRIELCFEGFRFWDIRRWNDLAGMKSSVKGAYITNNAGVYSYVYTPVEDRKYTDAMLYGPIPYNETVKYSIEQNKGW
jgi:starch-binding outer membrane protein, SusD/RagB family